VAHRSFFGEFSKSQILELFARHDQNLTQRASRRVQTRNLTTAWPLLGVGRARPFAGVMFNDHLRDQLTVTMSEFYDLDGPPGFLCTQTAGNCRVQSAGLRTPKRFRRTRKPIASVRPQMCPVYGKLTAEASLRPSDVLSEPRKHLRTVRCLRTR
jgi:hypothetical protein